MKVYFIWDLQLGAVLKVFESEFEANKYSEKLNADWNNGYEYSTEEARYEVYSVDFVPAKQYNNVYDRD